MPLLPRRRLWAQEHPEDAHRDGAREAQGPRLRLLQRRGIREGQHPEEAHRCGPLEDQAQQSAK